MTVARTARSKSEYDVHPSVEMVEKWVADLKQKTGRSLDEWLKLIRKSGPGDEASSREWLKNEHHQGKNAAAWLVEKAFATPGVPDEDTPEGYLRAAPAYVENLYAGGKTGLRPIHDALIRLGRGMGADIKVCPCKTMVPIFRNHVIAQIKPSTRTRIDFGLALGKMIGKKKLPARLIDTGGFAKKDRITHRIALSSTDEIDEFVKSWLKSAYELDA